MNTVEGKPFSERIKSQALLYEKPREHIGKQRARSRIYMTPANNVLAGGYSPNTANIHITLDSKEAPFTVVMPSVNTNQETAFWFYNIPSSGNGYTVTISGKINNTESIDLEPGESAILTCDLIDRYIAMIVRV